MELSEVLELEELNELDLLYKIIDISESIKKDTIKVLKGQKEAGIRVRNKMQDIKLLCESIRDKIQIRKGTKWSIKRNDAIIKAVKKIKESELKNKELNKKRKLERLAKIRN